MTCRQCGTVIADKAIVCYRCGTATAVAPATPSAIPSMTQALWLAIMFPLGLIAGLLFLVADYVYRGGVDVWWMRLVELAGVVCYFVLRRARRPRPAANRDRLAR